ncbi:MAG: endonuclease/exonuclease/phosphatase family protein [Anaerolineales bacterium]|nr:endonuclease/exonuclease/phosphatase family protein [Anaerolineales bacterium]
MFYLISFLLWLLLRWMFKDSIWWLALINSYILWFFLPLPILFVVGLLRRQTRSLLYLVVPILIFTWLYGALLYPPPRAEILENGRVLTAMTFNLLTKNYDFPAIVKAIQSADADVVGLQEVHPRHANALQEMLSQEYPYQFYPPPENINDVAILSRYPFEISTPIIIPPRDKALYARLDVDGQEVHVFVAHLMPNQPLRRGDQSLSKHFSQRFSFRSKEILVIQKLYCDLQGPALLLCDCNLTDTSQAYRILDATWDDSFQEVGWGLGLTAITEPVPFPMQRIDYIWHTSQFIPMQAMVGTDGGSDHLPVVSELVLLP